MDREKFWKLMTASYAVLFAIMDVIGFFVYDAIGCIAVWSLLTAAWAFFAYIIFGAGFTNFGSHCFLVDQMNNDENRTRRAWKIFGLTAFICLCAGFTGAECFTALGEEMGILSSYMSVRSLGHESIHHWQRTVLLPTFVLSFIVPYFAGLLWQVIVRYRRISYRPLAY